MSSMDHFDVCIVGAGVIGLALAYKLSHHRDFKDCSIVLLEKNKSFGEETSSRNSEVIHAGIYYPPKSLKAQLCVEGRNQLYDYASRHNIPHNKLGKLIVAKPGQEGELAEIINRANENGVTDLEPVSGKQLANLEPELNGSEALFSPSSGIIDSHAYMSSLLAMAENAGAIFSPLTEAREIARTAGGYKITTQCQDTIYTFSAGHVVNCAGLSAQKIAGLIEGYPETLIPVQKLVKGSYFTLKGKSPFSHLIYPVPEKHLKGLGIHVTLDMSGQARFGPDAETVAEENYSVDEERESLFREAIEHYYPGVVQRELQPGYCGVRPKLVVNDNDKGSGRVADFKIQDCSASGFDGLVQLFGIESPGLTASLAIADRVVNFLSRAN